MTDMGESMSTPKHFTRKHQQKARASVSSASCARNGSLGAKATIAKYGFGKFFESWRRWKLQHPSQPETTLIGILNDLGVMFEREWRLEPSYLTLDFFLSGIRKGIEFHGRVHSQLKQRQREANDEKKRELLTDAEIETLWIDHTEMSDIMELTEKIRAFLTSGVREKAPTFFDRDIPF